MEERKILNELSIENIPKLYTLNGKEKWARVVDVYDGDTLNIIFFVGSELQNHKFRLYGIDTPEIKPLKSISNRDEVIDSAKKSKEYLASLILNKVVYIKFRQEEKYGRLMGEIYFDNTTTSSNASVNQLMVQNGYAYEYFGGKKK
jgi:endonuclease YncB( thermonuclease family)